MDSLDMIGSSPRYLNEVLSIRAQEFHTVLTFRSREHDLNEVLSIRAQELRFRIRVGRTYRNLNEVLSIRAQESYLVSGVHPSDRVPQ